MPLLLPFDAIFPEQSSLVGGKALRLAEQARAGLPVLSGACITTEAYRRFLESTDLATQIRLQINRLPLGALRWEELWDTALRVRNLFLTTELPADLAAELLADLPQELLEQPLIVRSSSPQEDQEGASFAGLHESYLNIQGPDALLEHIRLVWASLWSDGALLYRQELGIDLQQSAMAVLIQPLLNADSSGVAFSESPSDPKQSLIEAVHGLNQGLVDGSIEPDRWQLKRTSGALIAHRHAERHEAIRPVTGGTAPRPLSAAESEQAPLTPDQLQEVYELARLLEAHYGAPQDLEWSFAAGRLYLLQCRPITTLASTESDQPAWSAADKRPWYLSLKRSFSNLRALHQRIENELLPQMDAEADQLDFEPLERLDTEALIGAIKERQRIHRHWVDIYWAELIPFAHGARLFGQVYNDLIKPSDPYEFTALLTGTRMTALQRNQALAELAEQIRQQPALRQALEQGEAPVQDSAFAHQFDAFLREYGDATYQARCFFDDQAGLIQLLLQMATQPPAPLRTEGEQSERLKQRFLDAFASDEQPFAHQLLQIGRASYELRDNDNLILSRIEAQLLKALTEARARLSAQGCPQANHPSLKAEQLIDLLRHPERCPTLNLEAVRIDEPIEQQGNPQHRIEQVAVESDGFVMRARQFVGQPAGPGLARGKARVIQSPQDLFAFEAGEILVCDAIDPNMTFVVPLAAAVVERRGGMLVHGAIIAREYGIPCITGVLDATELISTGDPLTVDGYLGTLTLHRRPEP